MEWYERPNIVPKLPIKVEKDIQYFVDNIARPYEFKVDLYDLMCDEYFEIWDALLKGKANKFYLGGGRGSGKSYAVAYHILFDIITGRFTNWIVFMWEKVDNSQRTMLLIEKIVAMYVGKFWPELRLVFEKKDSAVDKELTIRIGQSKQVIRFMGAKDIDKGTPETPQSELAFLEGTNTVWKGFWFEEVSGSEDKGGVNEEKAQKMLDKVNRLRGSLLRFLPEGIPLTEFYTFNPYAEDNPLTKNWIEKHDKLLEEMEWEGHKGEDKFQQLIETGYCSTINEEDGEMYISTNRILSYRYGVLNQQLERFEYAPMFRNNPADYWVEALGRAGSSTMAVYGSTWGFIRRYQARPIYPSSFTNFKIGLDIGYGGEGETAMVLAGRYFDTNDDLLKWVVLEEITLNYQNEKKYDRLSLIRRLVQEIANWEVKYPLMKELDYIHLITDEDRFFVSEFKEKWRQDLSLDVNVEGTYKFHIFTEKHKKKYMNALRPQYIEPLLTHGLLQIYNKRTEKVYNQFRSLKYTEDKWVNYKGKRIKDVELGHDDARQAVEMLIYGEINFLTGQLVKRGIDIKWLNNFTY